MTTWLELVRLQAKIDDLYKTLAEAHGLSVIQLHILLVLFAQDGQQAGRIAAAVGRAATSFTPILDKIAGKGFIYRSTTVLDRRVVHIHLTQQGEALRGTLTREVEWIEAEVQPIITDWSMKHLPEIVE
jgi:DNA-binding MarR family transcriptional regulator